MRVALLIAAGLAALCPPASGQTVFSRPYEPNQIAVEAIVPGGPHADPSFPSGATFLTAPRSLTDNVELTAGLPLARYAADDSSAAAGGTPYVGVGPSSTGAPVLPEPGARMPAVPSNQALVAGRHADPGRSAVEAPSAGDDAAPMHHVVREPATVFTRADSSRPYLEVDLREPLYLLEDGPRWSRVRTEDGATGWVRSHAISNVWVHVSKDAERVYLYEGTRRVVALPADFGYNAFMDKKQRGSHLRRDDWRTPEGTLYVVRKDPHSQFDRALVLNYPTAEDAARGLENGLITEAEHDAIVEAQKTFDVPPMDTALGGMIEIHGEGTGAARNWTRGCVALHNRDLDRLWNRVDIGTPVVIE